MKSEQFKFSSESSAIRGNSERGGGVEKRNWDRIVYLVLLGLIILSLGYYLLRNSFATIGEGRVMIDQLSVTAPVDIRIEGIRTEVGKVVRKGDPLFSFSYIDESPKSDSLNEIRDRRSELQEERIDLQSELANLQHKRVSLQSELQYYRDRQRRLQKEVELGVETLQALDDVEEEIMQLKLDIRSADQDIKRARRQLSRVEESGSMGQPDPLSSQVENGQSDFISPRTYEAPVNGRVSNIFKESFEVALRADEILSIQRDSARVMIKVVFDRDDGENLTPGSEVSLRFNNGEESRGIITDIYVNEADVQPIINTLGIEESDKIVAELRPASEKIGKKWRRLNGMGLSASKSIF